VGLPSAGSLPKRPEAFRAGLHSPTAVRQGLITGLPELAFFSRVYRKFWVPGCSIGHDFAPLSVDTSTVRCSMPDSALVSRCAHGCVRGACVLACGAGVLALLCVLSSAAIAMTACQPSRPSDARDYWAWRLIDGRQCWYQGQPGRSKATLFWPAEQPSSAEPEVEQPEQLAMADEERALLESYWPDLDTLPVMFPTVRWWPRDSSTSCGGRSAMVEIFINGVSARIASASCARVEPP
jgi:hypothetical protein